MKLIKNAGLIGAGMCLVAVAQVGQASDTLDCSVDSACQESFGAVCTAIDNAYVVGDGKLKLSLRDRNGMIGKVNEADDKVVVGKFDDADLKLDNIGAKLDQLYWASKQKISNADFTAISSALDGAHACVAAQMAN